MSGDIDPQVWMHPELRAAVEGQDWGRVFRTWRSLTKSSQTVLGERVGLVQPDVSAIERGRRRVTSAEVRQRIIAGLGVPESLLDDAPGEPMPVAALQLPSMAPDPDVLDRITRVAEGSARVDAASLDWLEQLLAQHRRAEDTIGSRPLVDVMRRQLSTIVDMHAGASGALSTRTVRLLAEHAQFLGWIGQDQNDLASALAWYDRAHDWALEAGDPNMAATTLSMKAHMAWSTGDARRCVALGEAARWHSDRVSTGLQGMAAQITARGHAIGGEPAHARALLGEAQTLMSRAAERPEDEPPWLYFYGEDWFTMQRGMAELHLQNWGAAADLLAVGLDALDAAYRRDRAWYSACLAHALAGAGETERAVAIAVECVPDASAVGRPHTWHELHTTAAVLLRRDTRAGRTLVDVLRAYD